MLEIFTWTTLQFGLAVGLLVIGVISLASWGRSKDRALIDQLRADLAKTEIERNFYRDKWVETLEAAEVGEQATNRLARGGRRSGGR